MFEQMIYLKDEHLDDIPKYIYHRDIIKSDTKTLSTLKKKVLKNQWVQSVVDSQWEDGSWGRFHSLSSTVGLEVTTEKAMRRLYSLGLDKYDEPIIKVINYMESYLKGEIKLRDRVEKKHDWGILTRLFVITWLLKFDSDNNLAKSEALKWSEVVSQGFKNDFFNESSYTEAYKEILKPEEYKSIWGLQNFYIVSLLKDMLPEEVESRFLDHILSGSKGIYYIYDRYLNQYPKLYNTKTGLRFFAAHELLSGYKLYPDKASFIKEWLFKIQCENGLWDFGIKSKDGVYMPLSDNWRKKINREIDCTIRVIRILKKFL